MSSLRIAVVQFAPRIGEVQANVAKARALCRALTPRSVDLVCFPEMAFTGYLFPDAPSIAPYLEHPTTGPTASFCAELAQRLHCFVVAGFPERLAEAEADPVPSPSPLAGTPIGANAARIYDPSGAPVHAYHKSNLFPTDRTWARPGAGFCARDVGGRLGRVGVAICNDLNVTAGTAWETVEEGPYELAGWCRAEGVRVLVLLNAWLKHEDGGMEGVGEREGDAGGGGVKGEGEEVGGEEEEADGEEVEPNWEVLNYWAMRLRPLWASDERVDAKPETNDSQPSAGNGTPQAPTDEAQNVIVVCCNRFGRERGRTFAGSSAMFAMRPGSGKPKLLHVMGEREEGVRVWTARVGSS